MSKFYLKPALDKIPSGELENVKIQLKAILGITSRQQLDNYIKGSSEPTLSQALNVEQYLKSKYPNIGTIWTPLS